jgi:mRNA interferase MazF
MAPRPSRSDSTAIGSASWFKPMSCYRVPSYSSHPRRAVRAASFRPEIEAAGQTTRVLVEQVGAVDVQRLGEIAGHLSREELWGVDDALMTVLGLR